MSESDMSKEIQQGGLESKANLKRPNALRISSNFVKLTTPLIAGYMFLAGCTDREFRDISDLEATQTAVAAEAQLNSFQAPGVSEVVFIETPTPESSQDLEADLFEFGSAPRFDKAVFVDPGTSEMGISEVTRVVENQLGEINDPFTGEGLLGSLFVIEATNEENPVGLLYFSTTETGRTYAVFGSDDEGRLTWVGRNDNPLYILELFGRSPAENEQEVGLINVTASRGIEFLPLFTFRGTSEKGEEVFYDLFNPGGSVILDSIPIGVRHAETRPAILESAPFPEEFRNQLTDWAAKQEDYKEIVISPSSEGGYDVTIQKEDATEHMFRLDADGERAHLIVDGEEVIVDVTSAGTKDTGGYNKFFFGVEPEEDNAFMWRYSSGGWVANWDKEFTENGVSIIANEAEIYGGLFTINTERAEELWEGFVGGIYQVNVATRNTALLSRYPTREAFLEAARSGVGISNVRIPIRYPDRQNPRFQYDASWEQVGAVNLSSVALRIPQFSREENMSYIAYNSDYIQYIRNDLNFLVEAMSTEDGRSTFVFAVKSQRLNDEYGLLNLSEDKTKEENFAAVTQNLNIFIWFLNEFKDVPNAHITAGLEHPLLNVAIIETTLEQREAMQNTGNSFLSLRD